MKQNNLVVEKSEVFAINIVRLYQYLCQNKKEFILSKQIVRSGSSIGANITEGTYAQSHADFIAKMSISLKEAAETCFWLELLFKTNYIDENYYNELHEECIELIRILVAITKTAKENQK